MICPSVWPLDQADMNKARPSLRDYDEPNLSPGQWRIGQAPQIAFNVETGWRKSLSTLVECAPIASTFQCGGSRGAVNMASKSHTWRTGSLSSFAARTIFSINDRAAAPREGTVISLTPSLISRFLISKAFVRRL